MKKIKLDWSGGPLDLGGNFYLWVCRKNTLQCVDRNKGSFTTRCSACLKYPPQNIEDFPV